MPTHTVTPSEALSEYLSLSATLNTTFKKYKAKKVDDYDMSKPLIAKEGFAFGCDPEAFIFENDKPIPAVDIIPGTKHEPYPVKCGAVQVDGMAAEFNIDPVSTYEDWEKNITTVLGELKKFLRPGQELRFTPSVRFDPEVFNATPDHAKELGCQPDFDAWTGGVNNPPEPADPFLRCIGGHVHLSWTKDEDLSDLQHLLNCQDLAKQLDFYLGAWSTTIDTDVTRRSMYGKMGAIRYKTYGVEYRTLSSFWVETPELRRQVWDRMNAAIHAMSNIYMPDRAPSKVINWLRESINKGHSHGDLNYFLQYPVQTLDQRRLVL